MPLKCMCTWWYNRLHQKLCQTYYSWTFAISLKYTVSQNGTIKTSGWETFISLFGMRDGPVPMYLPILYDSHLVSTRLEMSQITKSYDLPHCSTFALKVVLFGSRFLPRLLCMKSMTFTLSIVLSNLHSRSHKYRITIYTISFEKLTKILKYLCSLTLVSNIRPFWCHLCFKAIFTGFRKYYNKLDDVNKI